MPQINGRSLEQVRRYDLFKLAVAVLLFIAWLFFTDRMPMGPSPGAPADDAAGIAADAASRPAADIVPTALRIESVDGRIRLHGSVPDEATRDEYLASVRKALGPPGHIDDDLSVVAGAARPEWVSRAGPAIGMLADQDGVSVLVDAQQVVLEGGVAGETQRTGIADAVTAAFGAPFTVINRLVIVEPPTASKPALRIAPAPVSVFFGEGVAAVSSGDDEKLAALVRHARDEGVALRVSGFHSKTGSAQRNAEIARERAVAVRDLLVGLGVAAGKIVLDKPQETLGEEEDRRARRVDVAIDG
ncbi:MAG: OmpA family protein [Burkholderiaceae bacterium]